MGGQHLEGERAARWHGARGSTRTKRWARIFPLRLTLLALLIGACGGEGGEPPPEIGAVTAQLTTPAPASITLTYPASVNLAEVPILGSGLVRLNDGVKVYPAPGSSSTTVVNVGTLETNLGVESKVGHVRSKARVVMRDRAWATGRVVSASSVQLMNGAHADGGVSRYTPIPMTTQTLTLPSRGASRGPINLEPDRNLYLEPGTYDDVSIKSRSTLRLRTGLYQLKALTFEPQANLVLDDADGPVELFLTGTFTFRGTVTSTSGPDPKLFIVDTSPNQVTIDAPFRGTIIAPSARIAFISTAAGHYGTFFGKDIEIQPSTPIYHRPPDWDAAINGPSHVTLRWMDGSAILRAADPPSPEGVADAHVTLPELISFTIPRRLRVTQGNAGNRSATFKYRDGQNGVVTCTYRGGASVADPTTGSLDEARGLHYDLLSCSNGAAAGSSALGSEFWLTIDGCASVLGGFTMVEVHLNGCGGTLEPPMEPEDSVALVEGFSWQSTAPVPETDADGRPSLYYALIYLEDPEQLAALDDALIHWDPMPLFQSELDRFDGQCGSVQGVFDGEGVFVYAMLPGVTYNLLRSYALSPYVDPDTGDDQTIFDVVILRAPPPEAANPDGSVSWQALEDSGFLYLGVTELESVDDEQQQPRRKGKFRKFCRNVARAVGGAVREVVRGVVLVLGQASLLLGRDCELAVTVQVNNRDPAFPGEMTQAWGADPWVVDPENPDDPDRPPPRAARPTDTKVDVKLTFASLIGPLPSLPMPTLFSSKTNSRGIAHLTVPRSDQLNGVQPRGLRGPICVHLKNDVASITNYLLYDRVCGFDSGGLHLNRSESSVRVVTDHKRLHLWNSLLDANRYLSKVADYPAQPVQVLTGWVANRAGFPPWEDHAAFAGCLGLNQREDLAPLYLQQITALQNLLPIPPVLDLPTFAVSAVGLALSRADIVYPDNTERHRNSRGVVAHEYGHFALCSLLYDRNPDLLNMFLKDRIWSGETIEATDEVSVLSDAFADFIAAQVVGGVDYPDPSQMLWSNGVSYCAWTATGLPCMEGNANGLDTSGGFLHMDGGGAATAEGYLELARVGTIWHDAFDGHYVQGLPRNANVPGNADYYNVSGASLQLRNTGWVTLHGALRDENVSLPGTVIDDWVKHWLPIEDFPHFSVGGAMMALAGTMYDQGVTWCDACELFALHEAGAPMTPFNDLWNACTQGRLAGYLGVPPDDRLNMDPTDCEPCKPLFYVDPTDGICKACPAGYVAITGGCDPCPVGQVPRADGSCDACADDQFAQGNVCIDCPDGWLRDGSSNTCVPCPTDLVVDWPTASATCEPTVIPVDTAPTADDACPGDLIVEVVGLSSGGPLIPAVTSPESPSCGERDATFGVVDLTGYELWYYHSAAGSINEPCPDLVCTLEQCDPGCYRVVVGPELISCDFICLTPATCTWVTPSSVSWPDAVRLVVNGPDGVGASLSLRPEEYPEQCGTPTL